MLAGGLRRCKVPVNPPSAPTELCDVVLSIGARCEVCVGSRCYPHCGGVGHLPHARQLSRGGAGSWEWSLWSVREATIGYRGQLCRRDPDGSSKVVRSFGGNSSEEVMGRLLAAVDTAVEDGLASMTRAQDVLPPAGDDVAPAILALAKLSARLRERIEDIKHSAERRRCRLLDSVIEWLRQTEGAWEAEALAPDVNPRLFERAKQLHDSQLVDLFARIGGAL